jgi:ABC-type Fe3+/spermidine/putrescine transport system ATPase subunit
MAAEAIVELVGVTKRFGRVAAVDGVSFAVTRGEFCTLLGPSGCGKTTILRMIAGFEFPEQGDVRIAGRSCLDVPAHRRNLAMVFQGYALFPHRTVLQNVLFGLRVRRMGTPAEIAAMARDALGMVGLGGFEDRRPLQLSGGQQQRVALARALVLKPDVLLLDEPLGALDLKLRKAMRYELKRLQRTTGITTIYVTHDQEEAMSMSDRIVVLNGGGIEQIGPPEAVYHAPQSAFVGDFIGESNLLPATVVEPAVTGRLRARIDGLADIVAATAAAGNSDALGAGRPAVLLVRAERVKLSDRPGGTGAWLAGRIVERSFLGPITRVYLKAEGSDQLVIADLAGSLPAWADGSAPVYFGWAPEDAIALAPDRAPAGGGPR